MRFLFLAIIFSSAAHAQDSSWIRINFLGYQPLSKKVAIWCSKSGSPSQGFEVIDSATGKKVFSDPSPKHFGAYGPFKQTARFDFSSLRKKGVYFLQSGSTRSPYFKIDEDVYKGAADFCLRYMRQQRCGFNPFLKDSCHTHDGYTVYGPMPDGTHIDAVGGWHDASDYLQYVTTSANATYHLLMAYRDFKPAFTDTKNANGLDGGNGLADVMDEAKWGLDWLVKMNPKPDWMFYQIADDRDHRGFRIPKEDSFYNRGFERPVYFLTGEPQGLFGFKNNTKGTSGALKFASAFALGAIMFEEIDYQYAFDLINKSWNAFVFGSKKPGVTQTAPGRAPYFYEENNWIDDKELVPIILGEWELKHGSRDTSWPFSGSMLSAYQEKITPWLGKDTAKHYQWYPFVNVGHYEFLRLAKRYGNNDRYIARDADSIKGWYKQGIDLVWQKARTNAFYRGVPFIWCSNNLTTSFATQCYWYKTLTGDKQFEELEQANFDWLFGANPWGTSMVYGLPGNRDTPIDPHSAFTRLKKWPIDGGLVDGPVKESIFKNLKGLTLYNPDAYVLFQSELAVYHDDFGDYSTNEPTMDGTASLIYLLAAKDQEKNSVKAPAKKKK